MAKRESINLPGMAHGAPIPMTGSEVALADGLTAVPEPTSLGVLVLTTVALAPRRRRASLRTRGG